MFHELDIQATGIGDYETTEATENLVIDMVVNLIKIGVHLSKQPKVSQTRLRITAVCFEYSFRDGHGWPMNEISCWW